MNHELKLLPIEGQHPLIIETIKAMYCEECNKWYYKDRNGEYPKKCINDLTISENIP